METPSTSEIEDELRGQLAALGFERTNRSEVWFSGRPRDGCVAAAPMASTCGAWVVRAYFSDAQVDARLRRGLPPDIAAIMEVIVAPDSVIRAIERLLNDPAV